MNIFTCSKILKIYFIKSSTQRNCISTDQYQATPLPKLKKNMIKSLQIDPPEHFWKIHKN